MFQIVDNYTILTVLQENQAEKFRLDCIYENITLCSRIVTVGCRYILSQNLFDLNYLQNCKLYLMLH